MAKVKIDQKLMTGIKTIKTYILLLLISSYSVQLYANRLNDPLSSVNEKISAAQTSDSEVTEHLIQLYLKKAEIYRQSGFYPQAADAYQQIINTPLVESNPRLNSQITLSLATIYAAQQLWQQSDLLLSKVMELSKTCPCRIQEGRANYQQALNQYSQGDMEGARIRLESMLQTDVAEITEISPTLAHLGLARLSLNQKEHQAFLQHLDIASEQLFTATIPADIDAEISMSLAELYFRHFKDKNSFSQYQPRIYKLLNRGITHAKTVSHQRLLSQGLGLMAQLYESNQRNREAIDLYQQAITSAHQLIQANHLLFEWYWSLGTLFHHQKENQDAITNYLWAIELFNQMESEEDLDTRTRQIEIRQKIKPLFRNVADLLLANAANSTDETAQLRRAQLVLEKLKVIELQEYFLDECVVKAQERAIGINDIPSDVAVIYPVLLKDRIELLVTINGVYHRYTQPVSQTTITSQISELRIGLENRASFGFIKSAQQLYQWLIKPALAELKEVNTLLIIPDGALRTIPFSVLHDGKQFLVENYAIATTPGITLTDGSEDKVGGIKILINGLTEAVQGFPGLPAVVNEIRNIVSLFGEDNVQLFLNKNFSMENMQRVIGRNPFSIIHVASHGKFDSKAQNSFLLTHQGKITMDNLEQQMQIRRYSDDPVDLLTLSACQTAVGDELAALGLAGVAVKAGVRSAVGSLWYINDTATSLLITDFYTALKDRNQSKAEALQKAQIKLMAERRYRHPIYWAPYLLIGNWM